LTIQETVMATVTTPLLTAEEFAKVPDNGQPRELVRGRIVLMNVPYPRHGEICMNIGGLLATYVRQHGLGRLVGNDGGVVTERDPDTVRGPDVSFYSYKRVPPGPLPINQYVDVAPELVFEVRSHTDRWPRITTKVGEYLSTGVIWVCVLDQQTHTIHLFHADQAPRILTADDEFHLPDVLGDFRTPVRAFFA
jgi:Uma2 family endonuclease